MDGGFGICVSAPGGAITSVPNCTLRNSQLLNGTSMASPHVAGAVAIILSGLQQRKITYSPYHIRRALENCAQHLDDTEEFAQGRGLIQIDKTFDHLVNFSDVIEKKVRFQISCGSGNAKGIYIRTKTRQSIFEYSISVEPCFQDSENVEASIKINFNMKLCLTCSATFVNHPSHLDLSNLTRGFAVKIDVSNLQPGVHNTTINAYDVANLSKGPVFRIPVTVIKPLEISAPKYSCKFDNVLFKPVTIKRNFFSVPDFATWAVVKIKSKLEDTNGSIGRFVLHAMQMLPRQSCKCLEMNKHFSLSSNTDYVQAFPVRGGFILELALAKYWASSGEMTLNYSIKFHGIKPNQQNIVMNAADGIYSLDVTTLKGEEILPSISLKSSVQILK